MHATNLRRSGPDLAAGVLPLLLLSLPAWVIFDLPVGYLMQVLAGYGALALLVLRQPPATLPAPGLGTANRVTLGRATLVLPVAALALQPAILTTGGYWWIIGVSTVAMVLDGVDGWVARRADTLSSFGARFDMELDALLMLALSVLVWESGKVGPWVIGIGALRYVFVAAGWMWPALRAVLPPSTRRKSVCVVQGVALLICLGPIVQATLALSVASVALLALTYSFAVDTVWLVRHAP
jgi:phosphatidylglycerophosphate synthase